VSGTFNRELMARLRRELKQRRDEIIEHAETVMGSAMEVGAVKTQDYLEGATTRTGEFRETYLGGLPGRHLTGEMVSEVNYEDTPFEIDGDVRVFAFGWFPGHFQPYFYEQDVGEGNIPPARALERAYADAKAHVRQNMQRAVSG
jgi:hypothetical protein